MEMLSQLKLKSGQHDPHQFQQDLMTTAAGSVVWLTFYMLIKKIPMSYKIYGKDPTVNENIDLRNRMVSFVHGLVALLLSGYQWLTYRTQCGEVNNVTQRNIMMFSISYFIYDFLAMWYENLLDVAMTIHHLLCVAGILIPLYENVSGNFCVLAIFISEISNPPMTMRHIMRLTGRRFTKTYEVSEVSFIMLYFYGRIFAALPIVYQTLICPSNHPFLKVTCIGLLGQSYHFIIKMYYTLMRRYREVLNRKEQGIKLMWFEPLSKAEMEKLKNCEKLMAEQPVIP